MSCFQIHLKRTKTNSYRDPCDGNLSGSTISNTTRSTPNSSSVASNVNI